MSYPPNTRRRAVALFLSRPDRSSRTARAISAQLEKERHGSVSVTAIGRWLREDPTVQAGEVRSLGQQISLAAASAARLRDPSAMAALNKGDEAKAIAKASNELAGLVADIVRRAKRSLSSIAINDVSDLEVLTRCVVDLFGATCEASKAVRDIRGLCVVSNFADPATEGTADGAPPHKPVDPPPAKESPFAHLLRMPATSG